MLLRSVSYMRRLPVEIFLIICFSGLLLFTILLAVSFGSVAIPLTTIIQILLNATGVFHFPRQWDPSLEVIIWQVRMPMVMGGVLVGMGLAVAGALLQGMLRNPLADPYLMGTSSGAALGATISFVLPLDTVYGNFFGLTPTFAFVGAVLTVLFVYALARSDGQTPVVTLLLAGVVINAVLVAVQTLLLSLWPSNDFGRILGVFNWLSGGIAVAGWGPLFIVGGIIISGVVAAMMLAGVLDVFALGEEGAAHLGIHIEWIKFAIVIVASLLTAAAVSISGLIGFVGLITPHFIRLLFGPRHRLLLPLSGLAGAIFLTLADLVARTIVAPVVLPVGVFTALVGAPFFLFLLKNSKREYKW